jgi:hypothetical protein
MGKLVNLRTVRKQRDRAASRRDADAAAARHAAASADTERIRAEAELTLRRLDGHRRDDAPPGTPRR